MMNSLSVTDLLQFVSMIAACFTLITYALLIRRVAADRDRSFWDETRFFDFLVQLGQRYEALAEEAKASSSRAE